MTKTILLTGATDGIGFETAKMLVAGGHRLLLHGRNHAKLASAKEQLLKISSGNVIETYRADLSRLPEVEALASEIKRKYTKLDVLINNAGVFKISNPKTDDGYDVRFMVNTIAPYLLTKALLPLFSKDGRVVNLSSAAQAAVDLEALAGQQTLSDSDAYAQSKLGITMWTNHLADSRPKDTPVIVSVNPASFLGSKMVKEAYGTAGKDLSIGADILVRAALSHEFANASGRYFDNDRGQFARPHPDALDTTKNEQLVRAIEDVIVKLGGKEI